MRIRRSASPCSDPSGRPLAAVMVGCLLSLIVAAVPVQAQEEACEPGDMPYAGVPGADLTPEAHVSQDAEPVRYVRWRGTVPSFDGLPLSVDVTVPCGADGEQPTMLMAHGFGDDKTVWQETGKSDRIDSEERPQTNSRWNNIWFASRGYTVVNYTARGWRDSCGPDTPGSTPATPAPQCLAHDYWIHLDDKRWEVRDAQWLAGALVESGHADPARLGITGGSYGGAPAIMGALLADRVMCGAAPMPAELGEDPCAGRGSTELAAWTTPDGSTPLTWAASVPLITFGDLVQVLAPNGRTSDGWEHAPAHGDVTSPIGVPIESTLAGLLAIGNVSGHFAPPGIDPESDILTDASRVLAGNPFPEQDPILARAVEVYRELKSPITITPQGAVPIFWVHGLTDPLFPAFEPLTVMNAIREADPDYPFKLFLGDFGHDYTGQRADEWALAIEQMNDFVDHHLRPDRTPIEPAYDVGATVTRCLEPDAPMRFVSAPTWHDLHPHHVTLVGDVEGTTSTAVPGPAALATDPISTATLPLPGSYPGCRIMRPSEPDPTAVTEEFELAEDLVLMGGAVVEVAFTTSAPDVPLSVRIWDVAADGSEQGLVTRGTYRVDEGPGEGTARFQLQPQGYRFPAGHRLKVEVVANDSPYYQASRIPAVVQVTALEVVLPLLEAPGADGPEGGAPVEAPADEQPAPEPPAAPAPASSLPATGGPPVGLGLLALALGAALSRWREVPNRHPGTARARRPTSCPAGRRTRPGR
jgi:predicted acyl esterase